MKKLLSALLGLALLLVVASFFLPGSFEASRERVVHAAPAEVYAWTNDLSRWRDWTAWGEQYPDVEYTYGAIRSGVDASYAWDDPEAGRGEIVITASDPAKGVWYDIAFDGGAQRAKGAIQIAPVEGGTHVMWTMRGELGRNPLWRWMGLFLGRMIGADLERGLERLDERLSDA